MVAAKRPTAKATAKRPATKPAAKRAATKPAAKRAAAKPAAKRPAAKPAAKRPGTKPAAKRPAAKPAAPLELGPSRIVWVFRVGGWMPLSIGKLFVVRDEGSPHHLLMPRRRLMPGRYELMFARYGVRYPVTLTRTEDPGHADDMTVWGRVPL